nr:MAG: 3-oxosteroid 1-dehydrogenase [Actinomycetota bacterium]
MAEKAAQKATDTTKASAKATAPAKAGASKTAASAKAGAPKTAASAKAGAPKTAASKSAASKSAASAKTAASTKSAASKASIVWDEEVDLLVAGSGAAAMSAAIAGKDAGLDVLIVESTDKWGGTTAISGGGLWMPGHPLMEKIGKADSIEDALAYMEASIGDVGPASSIERRRAYLETIPEVFRLLERLGMRWNVAKKYPDYYPDMPGGMAGGRSIEAKPYNAKRLGEWFQKSRAAEGGVPLPLLSGETYLITRAWSSFSGFVQGAKLVFRTLGGLITGKKLIGLGGAYAGNLMEIVKKLEIPVRLESPVTKVIKDGDEVVGAEITAPDGTVTRIRARAGVMLGTGGFAHKTEWRQKFHGIPGYSSAPQGDLGTGIQVGIDAGADVALMDDAWWGASMPTPNGGPVFILNERSDPFSIMVDQEGRRFVNESTSYVDVGHAILEHNKHVPTIPCWLIVDRRHRRRYVFNGLLMAKAEDLKAAGIMVEADTIEELAVRLKMDPAVLRATVDRFNGFCKTGVDEDFGRGNTEYDRYYSDPRVKPNPNLGPLEKGPFQAFQIVPGDLGTKGGLLTDEHARVIDTKGKVIPGLYAAGNTTASVMGRTYPGAGATIGPATVFGYLGARHAATRVKGAAQA